MNNYNYILIGKAVGFDEVGELLSQNREVIHIAFDENSWDEYGKKLTTKNYDKMMSNYWKYINETFFVDYQVVKNGGNISIPRGKYDFWFVDRVES